VNTEALFDVLFVHNDSNKFLLRVPKVSVSSTDHRKSSAHHFVKQTGANMGNVSIKTYEKSISWTFLFFAGGTSESGLAAEIAVTEATAEVLEVTVDAQGKTKGQPGEAVGVLVATEEVVGFTFKLPGVPL
jgi:hypothetical protein